MRWQGFVVWVVLWGCKPPRDSLWGPPERPSHDLRVFGSFLADVHPEPFRFVQPEVFERALASSADALDALDQPTPFDIGRAFQQTVVVLGDFHTQIALPAYQPDDPTPLTLLPLLVDKVEGRLFVDASFESWPRGTELVRLGGVEGPTLWSELLAMVSVDGRRPEVQEALLERDFVRYFHLGYGMAAAYDVVVRLPDGEEQTRTLEGVPREAFGSLAERRATDDSADSRWPTLQRIDDTTAWLRLAAFGNPEHEAYAQRVDAIFDTLPDVETLVVDVRGNPGGFRTHGVVVLNHLLAEPYTQWRSMGARVLEIPKAYRSYVESAGFGEPDLRQWFPDASGSGPYEQAGDPIASMLQPTEPRFTGEVVLFADRHTNSAANTFALALMHHHREALFIGEEIGGDCDRHIGNVPVLFRAPSSDVVAVVSLMSVRHVRVEGCISGRGLRPDIAVEQTVQQYLEGIDPFWEAFRSR